ncbi:MAG: hypothetical protein A3C35_00840 [Omnitrophica bacterium RIFCSPHIGHO2_02_FULL_46_11]|nr:MAG: hypothetical protein A3A81_07270 [Omnitrophica bacterium RIFCSPLOWO2_01_FULL_45_10b]OGW87677.1 MAG: hypothetical protein A3C35_00840 [Omnitrophica bacterium RIFCSPHIGHO2_02_FULL_46_11]
MEKNQSQKKILLVDDDLDYIELTRTRLEALGYCISSASNGHEALEILESDRQPPDLVILDIEMPNQNGLTTLINLNTKGIMRRAGEEVGGAVGTLTIPVIVVTGLQSEHIRDMVLKHQVSGYVRKPYNAEELIRIVKELIG